MNILLIESFCPQKRTTEFCSSVVPPQTQSPFWLLKQASEHEHAHLIPRLSWSWTVLLPSDTQRKPITSITAVLLPFVAYEYQCFGGMCYRKQQVPPKGWYLCIICQKTALPHKQLWDAPASNCALLNYKGLTLANAQSKIHFEMSCDKESLFTSNNEVSYSSHEWLHLLSKCVIG
jgi:hypothetical protein